MNPTELYQQYSAVPTEYATIRSSGGGGGSGTAGGSNEAGGGGGTIGGSGSVGSGANNGVYTRLNDRDLLYQTVNESSILKPDPYLPILLRIDKIIDKIEHKLDMLVIQLDKRAHSPTDNVLLLNRVIDLTQRVRQLEKRPKGEDVFY